MGPNGINPLENSHKYGKPPFLMGKSTIDGPCSIAMLIYQRVMGFYDGLSWDLRNMTYMIIYDIYDMYGYEPIESH